jgi:hypothetical protein
MTPRRKQLRAEVHDRDKAVCSDCGLDCDRLRDRYVSAELTDEQHIFYACPKCEAGWPDSGPCAACGCPPRDRTGTQLSSVAYRSDHGYEAIWCQWLRVLAGRSHCTVGGRGSRRDREPSDPVHRMPRGMDGGASREAGEGQEGEGEEAPQEGLPQAFMAERRAMYVRRGGARWGSVNCPKLNAVRPKPTGIER